ncbi:uncharacterized protein LOC131299708 [Rhododendron vialii]|uniref:uncharacterized protein LOC131299708 n=1 Tax=Rhododendron vialii TaxID=182163 RepID=UPI00265EA2F1|nr:uncharacterized protein LOC131299708 [Rhododendron vialii]
MADDNPNGERRVVIPDPLPLNSHFTPTAYTAPSCVRLPAITTNNYEIKPGTLQMLPKFQRQSQEDPYQHITEFEALSSTLLIHNFPMDALRLILFQFTLIGNAKHWLSTLPANSITSWAQMSAAFLKKFFPIGKTLRLRQEITTFQQAENEQFYKAWERYGDLIRKCPHHDIPKWQLVQSFYSELHLQHRVMVDASCGGSVMVKNEEDAWQLFETMSEGSLQNVSFERRTKSVITSSDKPRGMLEIKPSHDLQSKVDALTEKVEQFLTKGSATSQPPPYQEVNVAQGYANAQGFSKPGNDPFSTTYNQGWSKHPNFSWKTEHQGAHQHTVHRKVRDQVGQIANALNRREEGRLPSQPVQPPGEQFVIHDPPPADAKVIMSLRNKREVETRPEKAKPKEHLAPSDPDNFGDESSQSKKGTLPVTPSPSTSTSRGSKVSPYVPKAPFPHCLNAPSPFLKKGVAMEDILEVFKQVKVNIPLLDVIKQVPTYAKFLKDLCTQKRKCKTNVSKKVLLTEQVSSVFQSIAPPKL